MAVQIIDLSKYKDRFGDKIPEGEYLVQVEDIEPSKSRAGNDMWNNFYRVVGGEYDGSNLVDRLTFTPAAMFRVVSFLQALGMKTPRKQIRVDTKNMIGRRLVVTVVDGDPYQGRVRSEVRDYAQVSAAAVEEVDLDDLANLSGTEAEAEAEVGDDEVESVEVEETVDNPDLDLDDIQIL